MRTLDELLKIAQDAKNQHEAKNIVLKEELQQAKNQLALAKASAEAAILTGNHDMHTDATHNVDYYTERVKLLKSSIAQPYYTKEQHNELISEIDAALKEAVSPLYARMAEIVDEWNALVNQLDQLNGTAAASGYALRAAGVPSVGMESVQWNSPMLRKPSRAMHDVLSSSQLVFHELKPYAKRRNEE